MAEFNVSYTFPIRLYSFLNNGCATCCANSSAIAYEEWESLLSYTKQMLMQQEREYDSLRKAKLDVPETITDDEADFIQYFTDVIKPELDKIKGEFRSKK